MGPAAGRDVDLRDRLGGGGSRDYGGDRRSSFDRGGDYGRDRGGGGFRDSWGAPGGGYRDDRRGGGGGGGGHRSEYIERMERKYGRVDDGPPPRSTMRDRSPPKPPPEVHYPTRDEQRAEAKAREERAAWRLATRPLKEFFANAKKGEGISPSTIRELLNELSEPPFAEGRLAPNARKAFELVAASAKETGSKRTFEEVEELVRGVVNPLYHLLTYGVKAPGAEGGGPPSSVAETIAEQMHTAAVKLLAASLDILSKGDATKKAVESAKGIVIVREQVAAKLAGRAPGGGRGDKETTVTRRDSVDGRGHGKGVRRQQTGAGERHGRRPVGPQEGRSPDAQPGSVPRSQGRRERRRRDGQARRQERFVVPGQRRQASRGSQGCHTPALLRG